MRVFSLTEIGKKRELNEDYIYTSVKPIGGLPNLFIVADGMGGHNAGDYASEHAVAKFVEEVSLTTTNQSPNHILKDAMSMANLHIHNCSLSQPKLSGMGTTMVVATCNGASVTIANVGDSRCYLINQKIKQITRDHSLVEEMISLGGMDKDTARNHPDKNIITRAVGVKPEVETDIYSIEVGKEDKLLLCSDGLTNMLTDDEIFQIVNDHDAEIATKLLVELANEHGGRDNISVILVEQFGGLA